MLGSLLRLKDLRWQHFSLEQTSLVKLESVLSNLYCMWQRYSHFHPLHSSSQSYHLSIKTKHSHLTSFHLGYKSAFATHQDLLWTDRFTASYLATRQWNLEYRRLSLQFVLLKLLTAFWTQYHDLKICCSQSFPECCTKHGILERWRSRSWNRYSTLPWKYRKRY